MYTQDIIHQTSLLGKKDPLTVVTCGKKWLGPRRENELLNTCLCTSTSHGIYCPGAKECAQKEIKCKPAELGPYIHG